MNKNDIDKMRKKLNFDIPIDDKLLQLIIMVDKANLDGRNDAISEVQRLETQSKGAFQ